MRKFTQILMTSTIILVALCPAFSATTALACTGQPSAGPGDPPELEAFFDDYLAEQMSANHVAGATVAVVKDGQVLFTKGYGYADVAQGIPVDPEKTVFILGSLSKLFTWTAVMQLVEQGQLDLDADVNTYLDFEIPATYPQPITLNHLMAHNAGFEDRMYGQMAATAEEMIPLGQWLKTHIPTRVRPPGECSAYANYGAALAGYIVERVSGMSYADYVEQNILTPLGMTHTTVRQPIPTALQADMTQSYDFVKGEFQTQSVYNVAANVAPAGAFRASAADVARFMIAHLNDGRYGQASILQPATVRLMHTQSFTHDPHVNGMAHGFWELDMNGQEIIGHSGSHFIFNSLLMLFPEHKLGVFVATNSKGGNAFVGADYVPFEQAFVDHFFPQDVPTLIPPADFAQQAARFRGSYHMTIGRSETTPEKLFGLMTVVNVQADQDELIVPGLGMRFVQVEPLVFRQVDDDTMLVFKEDDSGNITQAFLSSAPVTALVKNRWFERFGFNVTLLGVCVVLFLSFLVAASLAFFVNRRRAAPVPSTTVERAARLTAGLASLFGLLILAGAFTSVFNMYGLYIGSLPMWGLVLVLSIVLPLLALGMLAFTVLAWQRGCFSLVGRIHYTLVTLGALGFVWFMYFWNILGRGF